MTSAGTAPLLWRMTPHMYAWRPGDGQTIGSGMSGILLRGTADAVHGGYDGLEASLAWVADPAQPAVARHGLDRWQLSLDALFVQVSTGIPDSALDLLADRAVRAVPTGYRFLNLVTVPPAAERRHYPAGYDGGPAEIARVLTELARRLEPHGVAVCWHPHETALRDSAAQAVQTMERVADSPARLCLDLGCVLRAGEDPARLLRRFGPLVRTLHIRDAEPDGRWCESVGEGVLDLPAVARELAALPELGACAVEMKYERDTRVTRSVAENAARSAAALRATPGWPAGGAR